MSISINKLFHHNPVGIQNKASIKIDVLKETTSQLISNLKEVKQSAVTSSSAHPVSSDKINKCFKKLQRECNRIVSNSEKFQKKHYVKDHDAVGLDALKLNVNLNKFIKMTPMTEAQKESLLNMRDTVNSAIKSSTSTKTGNGVNMDDVYKKIAQFKSHDY